VKNSILCLPITIPEKVKTGLVLTPFVVSAISKLTGLASVCCVNLTGHRYKNLEINQIAQRFENFQKLLYRLDSTINHYWFDNNNSHANRLQTYCEKLATDGELKVENSQIFICQCGAVEVLKDSLHSDWSMDYKVLYWKNEKAFCALCDMPLEPKDEACLILKSNFKKTNLNVLPLFYLKEIEKLRKDFNYPLLISRKKKGDRRISLFGKTWQLDTDFCWSLLFCSLIEDGFYPSAVVISNRSFKPLVWSLGISQKLFANLKDTTVIVTPFVKFESDESQHPNINNLKELVDRYGRLPTKLLVASGLKWNQKEVIVNSNFIFWALKASDNKALISRPIDDILSFPKIINTMDGNLINELITNLRRETSVSLSPYQSLLIERSI